MRFQIDGTCTLPTPVVGIFFLTLEDYHQYLVTSLSIMGYARALLVNDKSCHKLIDKVRCRSIGVLKDIRKAHRSASSYINESLRDWSIIFMVSTWTLDSSFPPNRLHVGGKRWSIDDFSELVGNLVWKYSKREYPDFLWMSDCRQNVWKRIEWTLPPPLHH